jgi:hypothetical protein
MLNTLDCNDLIRSSITNALQSGNQVQIGGKSD